MIALAPGDVSDADVGQLVSTPWASQQKWTLNQQYGETAYKGEPSGHGYPHWHPGVDLGLPANTVVSLPQDLAEETGVFHRGIWNGKEYVTDPDGYGSHATTITLGNIEVILGHGVAWMQADGANVRAGDALIKTDTEGNATGPHLHFEVRPTHGRYGSDVNPWPTLTVGTTVAGVGGPAPTGMPPSARWEGERWPHQLSDFGIGAGDPEPGTLTPSTTTVQGFNGTPKGQGQGNPAVQDVCGFVAGQCTALMASLFPCCCQSAAGFNLGNGGQWYANAATHHWQISAAPQVGWVCSFDGKGWDPPFGHVALIVGVAEGPVSASQAKTGVQTAPTITIYSMNFRGAGVVSTDTVLQSNGYQGCFKPPCDMVNGPDLTGANAEAPGTNPAATSGGCPSWATDPVGAMTCAIGTPIANAIKTVEQDAIKGLIGTALVAGGAGAFAVAGFMFYKAFSGSGAARAARRVSPFTPGRSSRRPSTAHPPARVARATGGNRAAPAAPRATVREEAAAVRPTRSEARLNRATLAAGRDDGGMKRYLIARNAATMRARNPGRSQVPPF